MLTWQRLRLGGGGGGGRREQKLQFFVKNDIFKLFFSILILEIELASINW